MTPIVLVLERTRFDPDLGDLSAIPCPHCGASLTIHQPDMDRPERLLGTCGSCPSWFLVDVGDATLLCLPDDDELRDD